MDAAHLADRLESLPPHDQSWPDLEKGDKRAIVHIRSVSSTSTVSFGQVSEKFSKSSHGRSISLGSDAPNIEAIDIPESLPEKHDFRGLRWLRHRALIVYKKFFSVAVITNVVVACIILSRNVRNPKFLLPDLATATATNITVAILMRCQPIVNLCFTICCAVPTSWPLWFRRHCGKVFHFGGIHSGCTIGATFWFLLFAVRASIDMANPKEVRSLSVASMTLTWMILFIFISMICMSHPRIRENHHDGWELTHRFGGWTVLILLWIQAFLTAKDLSGGLPATKAYLSSPVIWLLVPVTLAIIYPWLHLRKVAVRSEFLSEHAVRLHLDYTDPEVGTTISLSQRPLFDWHGFATITNANGKAFSVIVSNAGDFTKRIISNPPTHLWKRGIPTAGVLTVCPLFKRVVLVATGSGLGPCLSIIIANKTPCRILWIAANPEQTYGQGIIDEVRRTDPNAVIHNTRTQGKQDLALKAYQMYRESDAEAVCIVSNKKFTTKLLYDLETRGIPAYGPIFDS
jgi:hypothetical protein